MVLILLPLVIAKMSGATPDILIVGAGISGLSAAAEGARLGLRVTVVDRNSVYGGVAVNAYGVTIIGTPLQQKLGLDDSEETASRDFNDWGGDPDPHWVEFYVKHSRVELFDWFVERGVQYDRVGKVRGNTVARFHYPRGGIVTLVQALDREIHRLGGVEFVMNSDVTELVFEGSRVTGVKVRNYRTGTKRTIYSKNVLIATGGFQNNMELVRRFWPSKSAAPKRILLGAGLEATGSGILLARSAGASVTNMDRQWNYVPGIQLPDDPTATRGVYVEFPGPIWVNTHGERFINEGAEKSIRLNALSSQPQSTGWMIFDSTLLNSINLVHPVFNTEPTKSSILNRSGVLQRAESLGELAIKTGIPAEELIKSVASYNEGFITGRDSFGRRLPVGSPASSSTRPLKTPPFFALQIYPITRKSMGGIQVDSDCRVVTESKSVVPGLYACGEATGLGGLNGKQSLEGTFVGAAILMGRSAARSIKGVTSVATERVPDAYFEKKRPPSSPNTSLDAACIKCHDVPDLTSVSRPGYRHFELSHRIVLERELSCQMCHVELSPYKKHAHKIEKISQSESCNICHSLVTK